MGPTSASQPADDRGHKQIGRYAVGRAIGSLTGATLYSAAAADGSAVELTVIDPAIAASALGAYAASCQNHGIAGLAEPIGIEQAGGQLIVVSTAIPGGALRALIERKKSTGSAGFAPRAAANLIGRLCAIVGELHARGLVHGALTPATVRVDKAGNIHAAGLGLAPLSAHITGPGCAPELASGEAPSQATDIYALGAILYETLVGQPPERGCARPSEVVPDLSEDVDKVIASAMHPSANRRPPSADALQQVLTAALTGNLKPSQERSVAQPSLAEAIAAPASGEARHSGQIAAALASDDEAWLVQKDRLDYGPFSMARVFEMIRENEILPGHIIVNKHTGERGPVEDHPMLAELVEEARSARDERRRADAEVSHSKTEKRRGVALYGFIALGVAALAGGGYFIVTKLSADKVESSGKIGSIEEGELQAKISFPTKTEKERRTKGKSGTSRSKSNGASGSQSDGWDDAVDLGDAKEGGGDERLDDSQINPIVQGSGGRLGGCLRKNGGGSADIRFIIKGTGRVSYVSVNGSTDSGLAKCIGGVMRGLSFPSFDGARTRANFSMSF